MRDSESARPLGGATCRSAVALLNKLVRRYLRWYINRLWSSRTRERRDHGRAAGGVRLDAERRAQVARCGRAWR